MMDALDSPDARRELPMDALDMGAKHLAYHSLLVCAPELGTVLSAYDLGYISMLNELFQCKDVFQEKIRGRAELLHIDAPHLHILAGTQPEFMSEMLPQSAYGMGFVARLLLIYHPTPTKVSLFADNPGHNTNFLDLRHDLTQVTKMCGKFGFTPEAAEYLDHWHCIESEEDAPTHLKLLDYKPKRIMHLLKTAMAVSAARTNDLVIDVEDVKFSLALLLEAEGQMPGIFQAMRTGSQIDQIEEIFHFVQLEYTRRQKPVPEARLIQFMSSRIPTQQIDFMLNTLIRSEVLKVDTSGPLGGQQAFRHFFPGDPNE